MLKEYLYSLIRQGLNFKVESGSLKVTGKLSSLGSDDKAFIKANKQEIINILLARNSRSREVILKLPNDKVSRLLSYGQQRLWLLDQIDGGSAHYNMPSA
ncbi:hypothetical protein, partial [Motilimonas sp. E26]|uniref:hypothetical protein n=1 Tax=Motilimonas sp. E26 TaxID=2865674 RepID=UPI001E2AB61B